VGRIAAHSGLPWSLGVLLLGQASEEPEVGPKSNLVLW